MIGATWLVAALLAIPSVPGPPVPAPPIPAPIDVLTVPSFATAPPADWHLPDLVKGLGRPGWTVLEDAIQTPAWVGFEGALVAGVRCAGSFPKGRTDRGFRTCEVILRYLVMAAPMRPGGTAEFAPARATFPMQGGTDIMPPDDIYHLEPLVVTDLNGDQLPEVLVRWTVAGKPQPAVGSQATTYLAILNWLDLSVAWGPTKVGAHGAGSLETCTATLAAVPAHEGLAWHEEGTLAFNRTCRPSICVDAPTLDATCANTRPNVTTEAFAWSPKRSRYMLANTRRIEFPDHPSPR